LASSNHPSSRLLKTPLFSPAQPLRAKTRVFPSVVLTSEKSSTYPTRGDELSWQLGGGRVRKGTLPVFSSAAALLADVLSSLRNLALWLLCGRAVPLPMKKSAW